MNIENLLNIINKHVPFASAESWDNVGLLIGNKSATISGIMTALDCTEEVVDDALKITVIPLFVTIHLSSKESNK